MPRYFKVSLVSRGFYTEEDTRIHHFAIGENEKIEDVLHQTGINLDKYDIEISRCLPFVTDQFVRERFLELLQDTIRERNNSKSN